MDFSHALMHHAHPQRRGDGKGGARLGVDGVLQCGGEVRVVLFQGVMGVMEDEV